MSKNINIDDKVLRLAKVLSVTDDQAGLRIKVRLTPDDKDIPDDKDLPFVFPLLPKLLHVNPKVGEYVLIIPMTQNEGNGDRFFIGPVTSQQYGLFAETEEGRARCLFIGGSRSKPRENPANIPEFEGTLPEHDDIALQGRDNADIILKRNEVLMRCGFKTSTIGDLTFNKKNPAYIQMKYDEFQNYTEEGVPHSFINAVADRINLITHEGAVKNGINVTNPKGYISNVDQDKIQTNAHNMVYGDLLIEYLERLVKLISEHTHPMSMDPPILTDPQQKVINENLKAFVSDNIKLL